MGSGIGKVSSGTNVYPINGYYLSGNTEVTTAVNNDLGASLAGPLVVAGEELGGGELRQARVDRALAGAALVPGQFGGLGKLM